ncbi:M18 family aminopeptidase [Gordonia sp. X0973]|uniref:M18 family aminopeptidase n=1 Tax=Gordonia sp. X0973 TaxID=2742602 RepID=UPI000F525F83|nr:M18 family aminopeptidase [Gordonia sp. X0973]QKT06238.1 M18 family aminopeptidase [Gordonia sp. X0973]
MAAPAVSTSASAEGLGAFIDASPSPFHVCATVAAELGDAGFVELFETAQWPAERGRYFVRRGGSIIAWQSGAGSAASGPNHAGAGSAAFRIVGGHTDSPNLRVKQHFDRTAVGLATVALEPYGGAWLNSWLDRDLGLSGRVSVLGDGGPVERLVKFDEPLLRVPQLAIHLSEDRKGVTLDPQRHVDALWSTDAEGAGLREYLAAELGVSGGDLLGWELMAHDVEPSRIVGSQRDLFSAPRLDNQVTCYTGLRALLDAGETTAPVPSTLMLALFDHEEVGSASHRGAASDFLATVCERIVLSGGGDREHYLRAMAGSICASGDMAHATHPNYPDRHEPGHHIVLGGGPVLKVNQNLRYASDAVGAGAFEQACRLAGVPLQRYVHRADLPCGSTIGPITATRTGLVTVDVGAPQLAMHSARELMAVADVPLYSAALAAFFRT